MHVSQEKLQTMSMQNFWGVEEMYNYGMDHFRILTAGLDLA